MTSANKEEVIPVVIPATRKTPEIVFDKDEFLCPGTTIEGLSALRSVQPGGRIAMFAMRELERRGGRYGLFTSCCGGGQGVTSIIENLRR